MHLLPAAEGTQALLPATGSSRSSIPGGAREGVLGLRDTQGRLCVCGESHQALRGAVEKLQVSESLLVWAGSLLRPDPVPVAPEPLSAVYEENVDLQEQVKELEHRCILFCGEMNTTGELARQRPWLVSRTVGKHLRPDLIILVRGPSRPPSGQESTLSLQNQSAMLKACHRGGGVHQPAGAGQDDEGGEMNSATLAKSALRILFSLHKEKPGRDVLTAAEKPTALLRELQNPRSVLAWAATPPPLLLLD
ncbi:golgin subfamily A member 2 isoform X1 [Tupaia chinensis]|uniref:golgin subfamily A member 2 isoform X1 n=1 Tax=Tupaia chinensis TaxID=246437 RepID=UPI0003C900B6|nr:golgin subfamily A member 2 isoform X1 [Tupaia chinensis]